MKGGISLLLQQGPEILIVGAGPAGLTAGLALVKYGRSVTIIEKSRSPRRKLCGEFVSGDGWQILDKLGISPRLMAAGVHRVEEAAVLMPTGGIWRQKIAGLGFGCSRSLMASELERAFLEGGGRIEWGVRASDIEHHATGVRVQARRGAHPICLKAAITLTATGQAAKVVSSPLQASAPMSGLAMLRKVVHRRGARPDRSNPWYATAIHGTMIEGHDPPDAVELFPIPGGYVGLVQIEARGVNLCGISDDPFRSSMEFFDQARRSNYNLHNRLISIDVDLGTSVSAGGFGFTSTSNVLAVGDAAGSPAPVLGQGLAMALQSGAAAAGLVHEGLKCGLPASQIHRQLQKRARSQFTTRRRLGSALHLLLRRPVLAGLAVAGINLLPGFSRWLVHQTRGPLDQVPQPAAATT